MRIVLLFSLLVLSVQVFGQQQKREVRGVVQDTSGIPLEGVYVRLISVVDTLSTSTDKGGQFRFEEVSGLEFRISYSLLGYQLNDEHYSVNILLPRIELVSVKLKPQATILKEVNIYGVLPVLIKGDTIQYNARAYIIREDDLVEDMMRQFPGVEISRNGRITAQGQVVNRVKVNGKDFFTGDVLTATRNLPANIVENIQIIDDYGEQANRTGFKNNDPERIINITLKKDKNRGMFGQVTGGIGTDYRYLGSVSANSFDDTQQFSVLGSTNNTNASLFSFGDVSGAGTRERGGSDLNSIIEMNDGINKTNSLGINYRDDISQKISTNGSYVFTNRENETVGTNSIQSIYRNNVILSDETLESKNEEYVHKLNWNVESKPNQSTYLKISPTLSFGESDQLSDGEGSIKNRKLTTNRSSNSEQSQRSPNLNLEVFFNKNFSKPGRNFSVNMLSNLNSNKKKDRIDDYRINIDSSLINPSVNVEQLFQTISNEQINNDLQLQASYVEPITNSSFLEINYEYTISSNESNRSAMNIGQYNIDSISRDSLYINYAYKFKSNKIGFNYLYKDEKISYQLGFGLQPTRLSGYTYNHDISTSNKNVNFVPSARFTYKVDQYSSLSVSYLGQNNQPEFYQIQPIRDISNPQSIIVGNPELQSEFSNNLSFQYRKFNLVSGNAFFSNLSFKNIQNKIVANRTVIPNSTKQETSFLNTFGYFDTHAYYLYSLSLIEKIFNVNISGSVDYNNNISYINSEKNKGRNLNYMQGIKVNYTMEDWFSIDLRSSFSLNRTRNSIPSMFNTDANTLAMGLGGKAYQGKWSLSFDVSTHINNGFSSYVNANPTLLNVYLERAFLKNDRGVIRIQGFDLLNQNTGISREVAGNEIYDVRNDRLGRYFLVSFNLRLQKFPKID